MKLKYKIIAMVMVAIIMIGGVIGFGLYNQSTNDENINHAPEILDMKPCGVGCPGGICPCFLTVSVIDKDGDLMNIQFSIRKSGDSLWLQLKHVEEYDGTYSVRIPSGYYTFEWMIVIDDSANNDLYYETSKICYVDITQ